MTDNSPQLSAGKRSGNEPSVSLKSILNQKIEEAAQRALYEWDTLRSDKMTLWERAESGWIWVLYIPETAKDFREWWYRQPPETRQGLIRRTVNRFKKLQKDQLAKDDPDIDYRLQEPARRLLTYICPVCKQTGQYIQRHLYPDGRWHHFFTHVVGQSGNQRWTKKGCEYKVRREHLEFDGAGNLIR